MRNTRNFDDIEKSIRRIIDQHRDKLPPERRQDMIELIEHGEWGIAFENLCTNLDDFYVKVSEQTLVELEKTGIKMNIDPSYWQDLEIQN